MKKFEINGIEYTFKTDSVDGTEVLTATYTQNDESHTIWTTEATTLPESEEEAANYINDLDWAVEQSSALDNMSYEEKCDKARQFIRDCEITDSREEFEASPVPMYLVEEVAKVQKAYIDDLESRMDFEGEDVGEFLDRHGIKWE